MTAAPYVSPDGTLRGVHASVLRRMGAGAVDWTLCLVASIPLGVAVAAAGKVWALLDPARRAL